MTGSLQAKRGKYYAVLNFVDNTGKRKQKWVYTGYEVKNNLRKAEAAMRSIISEYESAQLIYEPNILISDYLDQWLTETKPFIDTVTWDGYKVIVDSHVQPYFEEHKIKLVDANLDNIQQYFDYKATHGRKDGNGGLSPKTLRLHKNVLQLAFKEAMRHKLIRSNPCELVRLPKLERREYEWYNASEINTLLETIKDEPLHPLIQTTVMYGLRRSEVLGLQWQSIDFDTNTILIRHTVSMSTKVVEKDKTKNKSSYRSFPLFSEIRELLLQLKEEEQKNREFFGDTYVENDYIFKWANGAMYDPSYISHKFGDLLRKYNLPHIRFHDLRHPYVKHTTKIFSLRLMDFQAQAYPDARRKTRGACQLLRVGQSRSPVRPLCNRKRFSCLPPQSKMSWILYAISMRLSGYTSTRSISSSASSVVSVSASKIALDASFRLSCRACSSCFCFACANTAA